MGLKIVCSGHLVRHPFGGHSWHHLQYLIGFKRMGHDVTFFEDFGWPYSCYDPVAQEWTSDPTYGLAYTAGILEKYGLSRDWCFLAEDGSSHGFKREELAQRCRECDVYFNLSNINWIPELEASKRRILVDTDPVFTQIKGFGVGGPFSNYHRLFTYAENIHQPDCEVPTAGENWLPTRQPVVLDLWPVAPPNPDGPLSTVINWSAYGDKEYNGRVYGQKDREFAAFMSLPKQIGVPMEIALSGPARVAQQLQDGGWRVVDAWEATRDPWIYQRYIQRSRGEFCVAKHAYVSTGSGWFSDRTSAYLTMGRPAVVQDTGFSKFMPCGKGLLPYRTPDEARHAIACLNDDYPGHSRAARAVAERIFDARLVLKHLLDRSL